MNESIEWALAHCHQIIKHCSYANNSKLCKEMPVSLYYIIEKETDIHFPI
jgi:hypothetical protein